MQRVLSRAPEALDAFASTLRAAEGTNTFYDNLVKALIDDLGDEALRDGQMRRLTIGMATACEAMLMLRHSTSEAGDLFVDSRFGGLPVRNVLTDVVTRSRIC